MKNVPYFVIALIVSLLLISPELNAQNINTIVGTGIAGYSGDGSVATAAKINYAYGIAVDSSGNLYIADAGNNVVRKVNATTGIITTIAGGGSASFTGVLSARATSVALYSPSGVAVDRSGNVFIADRGDGKLVKVNTSGIISTLDSASLSASGGLDPIAVAVDRNGNVYYADYSRNKIWKKNASTGAITSIAGLTSAGYDGDGGQATAAHLNGPTGVAVDSAGNVYIADNGNNVVRKIDASGVIKTMVGTGGYVYWDYTNNSSTTRLNSPYGVAVDRNANVYISDANNNIIRKVSSSYVVSTIAGNGSAGYSGDGGTATSARLNGPLGICASTSGANIYIADNANVRIRLVGTLPTWATGSGSYRNRKPKFVNGTIQTTTTCISTTISLNTLLAVHDSDASQTETWSLRTAPRHGTATVTYTTTSTGGSLTPSGLSYTATAGYAGTDSFKVKISDGTDSSFTIIRVTVAGTVSAGTIVGATSVCRGSATTLANSATGGRWSSSNTAIASVNATGVVTGVTAGSATISYTVTGSCGTARAVKAITVNPSPTAGTLSGPTTVAIGGAISFTATTSGGSWSSSNRAIATVGATGIVTGVAAGAAIISYTVSSSCGIAYATTATTVTSSTSGGTSLIITTVAGNHSAGYSGDGGAATAAALLSPSGIAVNTSGTIYFVDQANNRVRKVTTSGTISTAAGNGLAGNTGDGGAASAARLSNPMGVAVDLAGNLYIADYGNAKIRKVNTSGVITTFAGTGTIGYSADGTSATSAQIATPTGVTIDSVGNLYFVEQNNHIVRKVNTSGYISTVAGNRGAGFSGDGGAATAAALSYPFNVLTDRAGNVYISDASNNRIRKVSAAGIISTFVGSGTYGGYSGDGGAATAATLNNPAGMSFDGTGALLIADLNNNRIRKVTAAGIISTIAGSASSGYGGDSGAATTAKLYKPSGLAVYGGITYITDMGNNVLRRLAALGAREQEESSQSALSFEKPFNIIVFPNPATGTLKIKAEENNTEEISVIVISTSGQIVYQSDGHPTNELLTISTENWSNGSYLIRVSAGNRFAANTLVVMH